VHRAAPKHQALRLVAAAPCPAGSGGALAAAAAAGAVRVAASSRCGGLVGAPAVSGPNARQRVQFELRPAAARVGQRPAHCGRGQRPRAAVAAGEGLTQQPGGRLLCCRLLLLRLRLMLVRLLLCLLCLLLR